MIYSIPLFNNSENNLPKLVFCVCLNNPHLTPTQPVQQKMLSLLKFVLCICVFMYPTQVCVFSPPQVCTLGEASVYVYIIFHSKVVLSIGSRSRSSLCSQFRIQAMDFFLQMANIIATSHFQTRLDPVSCFVLVLEFFVIMVQVIFIVLS